MTVPQVPLGDGLRVSAQGLGGMALTPVYGDIAPDDALATLDHAIDVGVTFIDTADVYGEGANEELIARLLARRRDEVTLATKFGIVTEPETGEQRSRGDSGYVRRCIDASLARLGTEVIDLYYLHRVDPDVPVEETVGAMAELVTAGKVRHLGLSEVTADELRRAVTVHPIAAVQSEWSVWSRDVEQRVVPAAAELGTGFVPYSPLGRGFLAGAVTDASSLGANDNRRRFPRFASGVLDSNLGVLRVVESVAAEAGVSPAQVALAWLHHQARRLGVSAVPIPGTRRAARIEENLAALDIVLTDDQLDRLGSVEVVGGRSANPAWVSEGREGE